MRHNMVCPSLRMFVLFGQDLGLGGHDLVGKDLGLNRRDHDFGQDKSQDMELSLEPWIWIDCWVFLS